MCGLTLFPRNVLPIILWVLMSMNAMSLESRSTIMTTERGSVILTSCASRPAARPIAPARATVRAVPKRMVRGFNMVLLLNQLEGRLEPDAGQQVAELLAPLRLVEHMSKVERQAQPFGQMKIVVALGKMFALAADEIHMGVTDAPGVERAHSEPILERAAGAVEAIAVVPFQSRHTVAPEEADNRCQLLVEAQPRALAQHVVGSVVGAEPRPITPLRQRKRRERVADLGQGKQ